MYDKLIRKVEKQAKAAFDKELLQRRQSINESLSMFMTVGGVVLDEAVGDEAVWEKEKPNHLFACVVDQFSYLRKFSPA